MIYIITGAPRQGKSYWFTREINRLMKKAHQKRKKGKPYRKVFSNFPVITPWGATLKWTPNLSRESIYDSDIFIDEAYRDFNSRNYRNFSDDEHSFFALNGQNGNDIYLIAHSHNRLDTVIREMTNIIYYIKKVSIPFVELPLWFRVESYLDEMAINQRYTNKNAIYGVEHVFFSKKIADTYNTHFFRQEGDRIDFPSWIDDPEFSSGKFLLNENLRNDSMTILSIKVFFWKISYYVIKVCVFLRIRMSPIYQRIKPYVSPYIEKLKSKFPYKLKIEKKE
jgi:hypothetical protein